jgi:hypothetical protein
MSTVPKNYGWAGDARADRTIEPTYEPDFAALVDGEPEEEQTDFAAAGEIMRGVFDYVFDVPKDETGAPRLDLSFRKFVCVGWLLRPQQLGNISLAQLAPHLGVCRATLSKAIRKFGDVYGIRNVLQKNESAREIYSEAQKRDHWRNRAKKKPAAPCGTTGPHAEHSEIPNVEDSA